VAVADLIAVGATNKDAAVGLFVSVRTIKTNVACIYRKLDSAPARSSPGSTPRLRSHTDTSPAGTRAEQRIPASAADIRSAWRP